MPAYVEAEKSVKHKLQSYGVEDEYVVVVPGARWIVKEWPLLNFGELCIRLCESGKKGRLLLVLLMMQKRGLS